MKAERLIPYYAPDGTSLGFRTPDAAKRLIKDGCVKASWGRKGHLRAIWLPSPDGGNPIQMRAPHGTRYSVVEKLEHGRCWKLRKLDGRDEDGVPFSGRNDFLQVVADCMAGENQGPGRRPACGLDVRCVQSPTFGDVRRGQDCRLAGIETPPTDVVLDELRRAKNAGERHLHCDHIMPIQGRGDPGRLNLENMQTLCDTCHRRKTMKENGLRPIARMETRTDAPGADR